MTKRLKSDQIREAYELSGLKINKIAKTRLEDGYYVYHRHGAERYSKAYPGRRRDFIDSVSKDSLGINITEARRRAGLPNLKNIKMIIGEAIRK